MNRQQKILAYATGFVLGCLVLMVLPRENESRGPHPWHAQTAPEGTYPMRVTDDLGREVTLEKQPRHFISLAPSVTEILFAMGMGDHLMAVTDWCTFPAEADALRKAGATVGSIDQPSREMIASYRPDLILGTTLTPPDVYGALDSPPRTVSLVFEHDSIDDILDDIRQIGVATGVPGLALDLFRKIQDERSAIQAFLQPHKGEPKPRVLFLMGLESATRPGWAPGKEAWVTSLIEASHAINLASELGSEWGEVSLEALLYLNPEILLLRKAEGEAEQARLEKVVTSLSSDPVWREVEAVRTGRIHWLPNGPLSIPGPRMVEAYRAIAEAVWK